MKSRLLHASTDGLKTFVARGPAGTANGASLRQSRNFVHDDSGLTRFDLTQLT